MTFQQLEYLLEVYHTASITKAAKNLFVSASAVSLAINSLEEELGYPVFTRGSQGLLPTSKGKQVIEYADRIGENRQLIYHVGANAKRPVRISSTEYEPCADAFARLLEERKGLADVAFSLVKHTQEETIQKLVFSELDCAILFDFEPFIHELEAELETKHLNWRVHRTVPAYIVLGPGHRLYEKKEVSLRDLENEVIIENRNRAFSSNRFLKGMLNISAEHILVVDDRGCRYKLVARGLGFALSRKPPGQVVEKYALRCIPVDGLRHQIISVTNAMHPELPEVRRFLELLDEELERQAL